MSTVSTIRLMEHPQTHILAASHAKLPEDPRELAAWFSEGVRAEIAELEKKGSSGISGERPGFRNIFQGSSLAGSKPFKEPIHWALKSSMQAVFLGKTGVSINSPRAGTWSIIPV